MTAWFHRFARKERIDDRSIAEAVRRAGAGQIDADLGGGVLKQRVARPGEGRSKGYRTLLLFRQGERAFFVYGFAKNSRENIGKAELSQFRKMARHVLALQDTKLDSLISRGDFLEVGGHGEGVSQRGSRGHPRDDGGSARGGGDRQADDA
ncbi:type II toxin-antitoxin system RelE/ParE family toxin [Geminicoccaceae bacterium 1502E]|nr:type II toxin-antitoxin system RelE/ParE family toxin [Geminicoccaceae bacterium 1502E]